MREVSTTVTIGVGSEIHNHDLEYRSTLKHVHGGSDDVIEVIPYKDYREQINELTRPYIESYNAKVDKRYQEAWDRYNRDEIKTKPRKRDYKHEDFDYYNAHLHDTYYNRFTGKQEELPMFRSLIVGFGDKSDRDNGVITQDEALDAFTKTVESFRTEFPDLKVLGATFHADENGFYHGHVDYKAFYEYDSGQGLGFVVSQERAFEHMGLQAEQSIINGRDKVPIMFNDFRNRIYRAAEKALADNGIRLQYGVSEIKDPGKDSSNNQRLEEWQIRKDAVRTMQHSKNIALDIIEKDEVTPEELKQVMTEANNIIEIGEEIGNCKRGRWSNRNKVMVPYYLFDQLKSIVQPLIACVSALMNRVKDLTRKNTEKDQMIIELDKERNFFKEECEKLSQENIELQEKVAKKRSLNDTIKLSERFLEDKINELKR